MITVHESCEEIFCSKAYCRVTKCPYNQDHIHDTTPPPSRVYLKDCRKDWPECPKDPAKRFNAKTENEESLKTKSEKVGNKTKSKSKKKSDTVSKSSKSSKSKSSKPKKKAEKTEKKTKKETAKKTKKTSKPKSKTK